jgi:glycosyltransferase involved in cell wall biosynthesis
MKKIAWITSNNFIDVDLPIIKNLSLEKSLEITWYVILTKNRINNYNINDIRQELNYLNIKTNFIFLNNRFRSILTFLKIFRFIVKLRLTKPNIIYIDCIIEPYLSVIVKLFFNTKRVIIALHDVELHSGSPKIQNFFQNFKIFLFFNFHIFSNTQKSIFNSKYGLKKSFNIPLYLQQYGESNNLPNNDMIHFLFFGTIRKNKGLEYLIEAANKLSISHKGKFNIKIAGKCNNWSFYDNLIIDKDVFEISTEAVPNENIADLYCKSHYIVLPYKDVTQSGPLMLAFNYGIPPITSNLPGFKELITDKEIGYLFNSEDSDSLYSIMSMIIDSDNSEYYTMKSNLIKNVKLKYNINEICSLYTEMFNNIEKNL